MVNGVLFAESVSNKDFAKMVTEFIKRKAVGNQNKNIHDFFDRSWWYEKMLPHDFGLINYMLFNASDMCKERGYPDTLFKNMSVENNIILQAWKMPPSDKSAQKTHITCGFPEQYNNTKPITMYLYLLVQEADENSSVANIGISINSVEHNETLHRNPTWYGSTENFLIMKSSNPTDISLLIIQITIPPLTIKPKSLVSIQLHRIEPTDMVEEYDADLYLESIILAYETKE